MIEIQKINEQVKKEKLEKVEAAKRDRRREFNELLAKENQEDLILPKAENMRLSLEKKD